jgi:phenylacetate-CoA ligase
VPYYKKVLFESGVVRGGNVDLENYCVVPVLTKDIIRQQGEDLYSVDHRKRHAFLNRSGGSTGQPVIFMQDRHYEACSFASRFLFNHWAGKEIGEPELLLWGSERDVLGQGEKLSARLRRWGFNTLVLNSFLMTDDIMARHVEQWNRHKPIMIWAYASSILEFSNFIRRKGLNIFQPRSIICAAETFTEDARKSIQAIFDCPVLNQYGSREAAAIACECPNIEGLHIFSLNNKVEILDDNLNPCKPGQMGKVFITTLDNYSMPLIRYDIGDMAIPAGDKRCSCGRSWPLLEKVVGRHIEVFKTRDGKIVPAEFFIHFIGVVYNKGYVKKFQVVQKDYDRVVVRMVVDDNTDLAKFKAEVTGSIKKVMGEECTVNFEYVADIAPAASGKYLYTISEIEPKQ